MDLDTDQVTFPPRAISQQGTRRVLDFLRRADRAWRSGVFDLSGMDIDLEHEAKECLHWIELNSTALRKILKNRLQVNIWRSWAT